MMDGVSFWARLSAERWAWGRRLPPPISGPRRPCSKKVKITDVKCMIVRGTWDWNLIKIETDSGLYGIGEAYWGWGVKDMVLNKMAPIIIGEDPLNVDKLYHQDADAERRRGRDRRRHDDRRRAASKSRCGICAGGFCRLRCAICWAAVSAIAYASTARCNPWRMWKIRRQWRAQCEAARAEKWGWTAFKFQGDGVPVKADPQFPRAGPRPLRARTHATEITGAS